jgi:hypothetical protein
MSTPEDGMPWKNFPKECHPKQRIFLSIDAINSTALKTEMAESGATSGAWVEEFTAFLPEVIIVYIKHFSELVGKHCRECSNSCMQRGEVQPQSSDACPKVWKYSGDEVLLVAELTCSKLQASLHLLAMARTIAHFNNDFHEKGFKLRFKGTAWVAAFPVTNIELDLGKAEGLTVRDFLGPSIDLGFRLAKHASEGRLIISASLAYLAIMGGPLEGPINYRGIDESILPFCFGWTVEAKGVKKGKHPLIWLPLDVRRENELCRVGIDHLKSYLEEEWFKDAIRPFILDANSSWVAKQEYVGKYLEAVKEQRGIPYSLFYAEPAKAADTSKIGAKEKMDEVINRLQNKYLAQPPNDPTPDSLQI